MSPGAADGAGLDEDACASFEGDHTAPGTSYRDGLDEDADVEETR